MSSYFSILHLFMFVTSEEAYPRNDAFSCFVINVPFCFPKYVYSHNAMEISHRKLNKCGWEGLIFKSPPKKQNDC